MKSGNLNFLESSGPLQACNGTDLPLPLISGLTFFFCLRDYRYGSVVQIGLQFQTAMSGYNLSVIPRFICLWFRASLICINNCPMRCNRKQSIYYSASSLYMFRVSTTPIIRSTQNCNYSLRHCAATSLHRGQAWPHWREVDAQKI